jgi:hypothetical protein
MKRNAGDQGTIMDDVKLPSEESIIETSQKLLIKLGASLSSESKYASVPHILCLIGSGKPVDSTTLSQYNPYYIKRTLKRLKSQELITLVDKTYSLTPRGKRWVLKYTLEDISIAVPQKWDGRWRMIIYDVARHKASLRNIFRSTIRKLGFFNVQESVWIHPYPCEKEISFLRDYCGMGSDVIYVIAHKIENDSAYREHFSLK